MIKREKGLAVFIALLSLICLSSMASAVPTAISIGSATVTQGDTTTLDVMINDVTNAGAATFNITYDPTIVQVTAASDGDFDTTTKALGTSADGYIRITAYQTGETGLDGNVLVTTLTLEAMGAGTTGLAFTIPTGVSDNTPQQTDIDIDWIDGSFTVPEPPAAPEPPKPTNISIGSATVTQGDTTTLDVMINNVTNAGATTFNITYDPTIVQVTAASDGDFDTTTKALGTSADGYIRITAYQTGETGLDGNVLVTTLTLEAMGVGTTGLAFNSPTGVSDNTPQQTDIDIDWINGTFTVNAVTPTIAIRAEDGTSLPDSIPVGETFTVLITEDGSHVGAGTNVLFTLPYGTGDPISRSTDDAGKVNYKPLITGTLGIRVLDGIDTVAEANVTVTITGIQTLGSITISPASPDPLNVGGSLTFTTTCNDTSDTVMTCPTLTWHSSNTAVGTITAGEFTALTAGTTTITASVGSITSNEVVVIVNEPPSDDEPVTGGSGNATSGGSFVEVTLNDTTVVGTVATQEIGDPVNDPLSSAGGNSTNLNLGTDAGQNQVITGAVVTVSQSVRDALLADVNKTSWVHIRLNYSQSVVDSLGIREDSIEIWKYNETTNVWEKVKDQPYCIDGDRDMAANYVWVNVTKLSTFALVGTKTTTPRRGGGGGGAGTYPPGWGGTPTATPTVTATAVPGVTPGATPPGEAVTKPTKPAATEEATPEGAEEAPTKKKGTPGFTAVFAIAGLLAIAYAMMRRRE